MKRLVMALLMVSVSVSAQDAAKKKEIDAMLASYVESAKPVAEHGRLAELAGDWKITNKLWVDPAGAPAVSSGTGRGKLILGGRFLQLETDLKGEMGAEGMMVMGFDRRTNDFTMFGIDSSGTYSITAAGKWSDTLKGVMLSGSYAMPPSLQEQKYRFEWTRVSDKEHLFTLYFNFDGKDVRVGETRYVRS
jgi:hypothetical protein